jgi:hypothetical protein
LNAYLITGKSGLKSTRPIAHKTAQVDPGVYDAYVGRYEIGHETILTMTREGDHLMVQPTNDRSFEIFPESATFFFLRPAEDDTITFVKDDKGEVTHIVVRRGGREIKAKRLDSKPKADTPR